ncbi:MAG: carboxypeptidase-like regulatory domain-containing protein [Bacteroidales bacterium]|nr:carboxypeptidase-like regulatory domain-containing protein [Bacteroidales bacterium]
MKKILLMFIGTLLSALCAFAQDVTVSGTVKDVKGEPVIGAAVLLEGRASVGTVTDLDGRWSLRIPSEKGLKLVVTCVSYKS